jgi:hypothetical protein
VSAKRSATKSGTHEREEDLDRGDNEIEQNQKLASERKTWTVGEISIRHPARRKIVPLGRESELERFNGGYNEKERNNALVSAKQEEKSDRFLSKCPILFYW